MGRAKRMRTAALAAVGSATLAAGLMVPLPGAVRQALAGRSSSSADASSCPWVTSRAPIATRVQMLLDRISIAQLDDTRCTATERDPATPGRWQASRACASRR